jgi:hypothetical protein
LDGTDTHRWARNLKNGLPQKQNAICKTRAQYAKCNCFLNYLKQIALQQLMIKKKVFTKKLLCAKNATAILLSKKVLSEVNSTVQKIQTWVFKLLSAGLNHHAIRPNLKTFHHTKSSHKSHD